MAFEFAADGRLVPLLAAVPGFFAALGLTVMSLRGRIAAVSWPPKNEIVQIALLAAMIVAIPFAGFMASVTVYLLILLRLCTALRWLLLPYVAIIMAAAYGISWLFNMHLP
jgi:hypothetical protein